MRLVIFKTIGVFGSVTIGIVIGYTIDTTLLHSDKYFDTTYIRGISDTPSLIFIRGIVRSIDREKKNVEIESVSLYSDATTTRMRISFDDSTPVYINTNTSPVSFPTSSDMARLRLVENTRVQIHVPRKSGPLHANSIVILFEQT